MEHKIDFKKLLLVVISFAICILFPNLIKYTHGCFNTWDFGIFVEAVQKISLSDLNPVINSYEFKIFNDHFDPILLVPSFLSSWMPTSISLLVFEITFVILSIVPIYLLNKSGKLEKNLTWFLIVYLMINKASITALYYPVHPTTWSVAVLSFMFYFLIERRFLCLFCSTIFLFLFKEEFPFMGLMVSFYFLYENKKNKLSIFYFMAMFLISFLWLVFAIKLRPIWFGGAFNDHGGNFLRNLFLNPSSILKEYDISKIRFIIFCFIPLTLVAFLNRKNLKNVFWQGVFISLPMIALRLLSGKFGFQYTAPFIIPFVFIFAVKSFKLTNWHRNCLMVIMIILSAPAIFRENYSTLIGKSQQGCELNKERKESIKKITNFNYSNCGEVFATGGAAFTLATYGIYPNVTKLVSGNVSKQSCIVLDLKSGDPYPINKDEVQKLRSIYNEKYSNSDFVILKN